MDWRWSEGELSTQMHVLTAWAWMRREAERDMVIWVSRAHPGMWIETVQKRGQRYTIYVGAGGVADVE